MAKEKGELTEDRCLELIRRSSVHQREEVPKNTAINQDKRIRFSSDSTPNGSLGEHSSDGSSAIDFYQAFSTYSSVSSKDDYYTRHAKGIKKLGVITDSMVKKAYINEQDKHKAMMAMLDSFRFEKMELRRLREDKWMEQSTANRMLKNEIIEMSERLERMDSVLLQLRDSVVGFQQHQVYQSQCSFSPQKSQNGKDSSLFFSAHDDPLDSGEDQGRPRA